MPANTVYVGRPSRWGNIFPVFYVRQQLARAYDLSASRTTWGGDMSLRALISMHENNSAPYQLAAGQVSVLLFKHWVSNLQAMYPDQFETWIQPLRGKNLACWCSPAQPCHADVLLEIAN